MEIDRLKEWFVEERRDLPWRGNPSPYEVWVSEVMLQQTQVSVVIGYFERWMQKFPSISLLAEAPLTEVLKVWEGLGYYSRARHMHEAAQLLVREYGGELPASAQELAKVKGLGPYTRGAILSFAFHQRAAAVDGNVARVLARYFLLEEEIDRGPVQKKLRSLAEEILPDEEPWVAMEALIELGARVCTKQPRCSLCPLRSGCQGFRQGVAAQLPRKGQKIRYEALFRSVAVVLCEDALLLRKGKSGQVMADLYEFPYFEREAPLDASLQELLGRKPSFLRELAQVQHQFTRFRVTLYPTVWEVHEKIPIEGHEWLSWKEIEKLPFSSGHRRILTGIKR